MIETRPQGQHHTRSLRHRVRTGTARLMAGLALVVVLGLAGVGCVRSPKPASSGASARIDQFCKDFGEVAFRHAHARDRGMSYLGQVEAVWHSMPDGTEFQRNVRTIVLENLRDMYETPHRERPAVTQEVAELTCLYRLREWR